MRLMALVVVLLLPCSASVIAPSYLAEYTAASTRLRADLLAGYDKQVTSPCLPENGFRGGSTVADPLTLTPTPNPHAHATADTGASDVGSAARERHRVHRGGHGR